MSSTRTIRTTAEAVSWDSWLRPPALSTICALVGLPLTTNVPENAAAALAAPRPTRSAVLAERLLVLDGVGPGGGRALGQDDHEHRQCDTEQRRGVVPAEGGQAQARQPARDGPDHGHAVAARSAAQLTMIAMITAISRPGIRRLIQRATTTTTMTAIDTATSAQCTCGSARTVFTSLGRVCLPVAVTPSMSGSCPAATWMPTPVRNPTSTVRDRKLARKPRRASRAASSIAPVSRAASPASRTYCSEPAAARPVSAAASMTAVAESAATTRWRDEPRTANAAIGRSIVYKPVTRGIPAILA